jgi:GxxExxY protein
MTDKELTHHLIGAAIAVHRELGPGLLEAVYEECLCYEISLLNIPFERQKPIPVIYRGNKLDCGYRADIVVLDRVIIEIKAIASVASIHDAVMLTYLRLSGCHIGLLINFHSAALKDGVHRYVWNYNPMEKESERRDTEVTEKCPTRKSAS